MVQSVGDEYPNIQATFGSVGVMNIAVLAVTAVGEQGPKLKVHTVVPQIIRMMFHIICGGTNAG